MIVGKFEEKKIKGEKTSGLIIWMTFDKKSADYFRVTIYCAFVDFEV